jgi:hypothetical protein
MEAPVPEIMDIPIYYIPLTKFVDTVIWHEYIKWPLGCVDYYLGGNYILRLPPVILEWLSPKMPRKDGHFNL